jgi:hypothetical protein
MIKEIGTFSQGFLDKSFGLAFIQGVDSHTTYCDDGHV